MMRTRLSLALTLFTIVILSACSSSNIPDLTPQEITARSALRMGQLQGFEFLIERSGEPVFLDPDETVAFRRAQGQFQSPDRVNATIRVILPGLVTEVSLISLEGQQWETNVLSGIWQISDPKYSFDPSKLFQTKNGLPDVLANDLLEIELVGLQELEELPGVQLLYLEGSITGQRINTMSFGMISDGQLPIRLWVDPESFDLHRMIVIDPGTTADSEGSIWQMDFWDFDASFDIRPPALNN